MRTIEISLENNGRKKMFHFLLKCFANVKTISTFARTKNEIEHRSFEILMKF